MGTNYYFIPRRKEINKLKKYLKEEGYGFLLQYNKFDQPLHIGKSSAGWQFTFQKTRFYSSLKEIKNFYKYNKEFFTIEDEYRKPITMEELLSFVENKKQEKLNHTEESKKNGTWNDESYLDEEGNSFCPLDFS